MRLVLQRVSRASVTIDGAETRSIGAGLVLLVAVTHDDSPDDIAYVVRKALNMRIFPDADGRFDRSVLDTDGDVLIISQFTLYASTRKGNRPSFTASARPESAEPLYDRFVESVRSAVRGHVETGRFAAHMDVELVNDGPVTIVVDSEEARGKA